MKDNSGGGPKRSLQKVQEEDTTGSTSFCSEEPQKHPCQAGPGCNDDLPSWTFLQTFSFSRWTSSLCRLVLASHTPFAEFLKRTLHITRSSEMAPEKALFPLPLPKEGVFTVPSRAGSRERRRRSFDQAFHVAVMALNFWHADYQFPPVSLLARHPSSSQARVLENLRRLMKAFGSSDETFAVPSSGRRSTSLIAQLSDLCDFVTWEGLAGASYERGFHGAAGGFEAMARVPVKVDRAPELTPYSQAG